MKKRERGSLTIEATISLTVFLMVIITILSFINYCRIQATISNAVDGVAKEISQYSYFYELSGLAKVEAGIHDASSSSTTQVNSVIGSFMAMNEMIGGKEDVTVDESGDKTGLGDAFNKVNELATNVNGNLDGIEAEFNNISSVMENVCNDPMAFMKSIAAFAGEQAISTVKSQLIAAPLSKAMLVKHFGESKDEASAELEKLGVVDGLDGLNFRLSTLFSPDKPEDIKIVVYYKMDLLTLFDFDLEPVVMCKEARARAWLGGDADMAENEEEEEEKETVEEWSIWDMTSTDYGKYITSQEEQYLKSNENIYYRSRGFDTYDMTNNTFTQYRSIDPYCDTYNGKESAFVNSLYKTYNDTKTSVNGLSDNFSVKNNKGESTKVDSDKSTRKVKMVIVVPEDADMEFVNKSIETLKGKINDDTVVIEVVQGYGKSPNNPANKTKDGE